MAVLVYKIWRIKWITFLLFTLNNPKSLLPYPLWEEGVVLEQLSSQSTQASFFFKKKKKANKPFSQTALSLP